MENSFQEPRRRGKIALRSLKQLLPQLTCANLGGMIWKMHFINLVIYLVTRFNFIIKSETATPAVNVR